MGEDAEKSSLFSPEPQEVGDADTRQLAVERTIDRLLFTGIDQRPASLVPAAGDLDVLVVAVALHLNGSSSICGLARRWGGIRRSMVHYFE
jgi:hypothetical protein